VLLLNFVRDCCLNFFSWVQCCLAYLGQKVGFKGFCGLIITCCVLVVFMVLQDLQQTNSVTATVNNLL
jgi:hypothetical protein